MTATYIADLAAQPLADRNRTRRSDTRRGHWVPAALAVAGVLIARRLIRGVR
jgi:hypothetical protein